MVTRGRNLLIFVRKYLCAVEAGSPDGVATFKLAEVEISERLVRLR
jgi:hypothetical protein